MISSPATPTVRCVLSRNLRIFKVATWHYRCRHNRKNNNYCIWDNLQCCLLVPRSPSKPVMLTYNLESVFHWDRFLACIMPPSHCRECCLRTNTNWHSLRIAQYRIDSNYFVLVRCHFRISSQPNTNVLKCSKHSYWPCESILFVLRRIASPNVVSIRVGSYCFVSHRCTFVSIRCTFALGFAACLLRLSTLQYDAQRSYCRIGSHMFALVRVSSY